MVVWEHGFSQQNRGISLGVVGGKCWQTNSSIEAFGGFSSKPKSLPDFSSLPRKCVQPFQVAISTGMSVLRLAFVHIDGDLYHSVLVPRLPQRVFVLKSAGWHPLLAVKWCLQVDFPLRMPWRKSGIWWYLVASLWLMTSSIKSRALHVHCQHNQDFDAFSALFSAF